jgi:hypothetical protein
MAKFASLIKGTADVRPVELVLPGMAEPIKIGARPLNAWEEKDVIAKAREFAKAHGVDKPTDDDPLYVLGAWVNTLLIAYSALDGDEKGEPFFGSTDEILKGLDRDRISYLYEMQQRVQEDNGFRKERLSPDDMVKAIHQIATSEVGDANLPFWKWGPSLRASFMHSLASLLYFSLMSRSDSGGTSLDATLTEWLAKNPSP